MKHVYVEFDNNILVTFNDIHKDKNGEHISLYFEQPVEGGFNFLETSLPDLNIVDYGGFTKEKVQDLLDFARDNAPLIWEMDRKVGPDVANVV
jgi:hypothetical protein